MPISVDSREVRRNIEKLNRKATRIVRGAALDGATMVADGARRRAPEDDGDLSRSIVILDGEKLKKGDFSYAVIAESGHASYVEFGTRDIAAQPFMRSTIDEDGDGIRKRVQMHLGTVLR